jgi:RHS repeat-associated protein
MTLGVSNQPEVFPTNSGWDLEGTINEYDIAKGKPKKFTMANWADPELYTWDANSMIKTRKFKDFTWTYDYFTNTKLVKQITNMDGQVSLFEYDNFQRVTKATARGGAVVTDYTYKYKDATQSNMNWVQTKTTFTSIIGGSLSNNTTFKTVRQYLDGLGRPIQSVAVANAPTGEDVVSAVAYDNQGREWKKYEPYLGSTNGNFVAPTTQLFTELKYEESPLSRLWKSILPNGWSSSTTVYSGNTGSDAYNLAVWASFPANSVNKTTTTDPDGRISIVYTDKKGRKIQTEQTKVGSPLNTLFYSYDQKDRLMRVWTVRNTYQEWATANDIDFTYRYDYNDNLIEKAIPGAAYQAFIYNQRNQLVVTHDGNMRTNQQFLATTYDPYGRPTATGLTTGLGFDATTGNPTINTFLSSTEYSSTTGIELGKVKRSKSYYNNGANNIETNFNYDNYGRVKTAYGNNHLYTPTGTLDSTNNFSEKIVTTYDLADNVLSKVRIHKPNATTTRTITETTDYDNGLRLKQVKHQINGQPEQTVSLMEYTIKNQVQTKQMGKVGSLPFLQKVDYAYNVLGWLTDINVPVPLVPTINTISNYPAANDYNPNIHTLDYNDLFSMGLKYENPVQVYAPSGTTVTPQYGGNISQAVWQVRGREKQAYTFSYDFLNRMTDAKYSDIASGNVVTGGRYNETLTYDLRGNIKTLQRSGLTSVPGAPNPTWGVIDNLTYYYADDTNIGYSPGNRLKKVFDTSDKTKGFKTQPSNTSLTNAAFLYTYDANGNLKTDPNKNIIGITYNHLNLPTLITFTGNRTIAFLYDGGGTKLKKTVVNNGVTDLIQDYVGGIEYRTTSTQAIFLEAIYHSEGRITAINGGFKYEYALRDHLGNTRIMFCDKNGDGKIDADATQEASEVSQENHYYPFGLAMEGTWANTPSVLDNKYQFNGIEMNNDFGLDMNTAFYRAYDPTVGRWWQIDPKPNYAESTYVGMGNNPITLTDPLGDTTLIRHGTGFLGLGKKVILAYKDGKLSNRDGSDYKGKVNGFLKSAVNALNKINSQPKGESLLNRFEGKNNILLKSGNQNETNPIDSKSLKLAKKNNARVINYSGKGEGGPDVNGNTNRPDFIGLAHELGHASTQIFGGEIFGVGSHLKFDPTNADSELRKVTNDEYNAVHSENEIRNEHGVPLREYYQIDSNGKGFMPFLQPGTKNNIITGKPY